MRGHRENYNLRKAKSCQGERRRNGELFLRAIEAAGVNLHGEKLNKR